MSSNAKPTILYDDSDITVAVKPAGLLSEAAERNSLSALLPSPVFTVHRLDRETEGIIVYAKSSAVAAALSEQIVQGRWTKVYTALICGRICEDEGRFEDLLFFDKKKNHSYVVKRKRAGVRGAALTYRVLSRHPLPYPSDIPEITRVSVQLETGRTHQIRVQFASRGLPLCGDRRYGAPAVCGSRLCLCASELHFSHPRTGEQMNFYISPSFFEQIERDIGICEG